MGALLWQSAIFGRDRLIPTAPSVIGARILFVTIRQSSLNRSLYSRIRGDTGKDGEFQPIVHSKLSPAIAIPGSSFQGCLPDVVPQKQFVFWNRGSHSPPLEKGCGEWLLIFNRVESGGSPWHLFLACFWLLHTWQKAIVSRYPRQHRDRLFHHPARNRLFTACLFSKTWTAPTPATDEGAVSVGLDCQTAVLMLHNSKLQMRILANRYDLPLRPGLIATQTPQAGELVEYGTFVGVTISIEPPEWMKPSVEQP
jgi:hypothetical protein